MADKVKHTLTFEGELPANEMDRAKVLGNPEMHAARDALLKAFDAAGAPHTSGHKVQKIMPNKGPRAKRGAAAAHATGAAPNHVAA